MLLLDTSIWIEFFNRPNEKTALWMNSLLGKSVPVCINAIIEMEVLQGVRDEEQYLSLKKYLRDFQYYPDLTKDYFDMATQIYRTCRKNGVTIRKSLDCIIAANCLIDGLEIAHHDRDFNHISSVFSNLKVIEI